MRRVAQLLKTLKRPDKRFKDVAVSHIQISSASPPPLPLTMGGTQLTEVA